MKKNGVIISSSDGRYVKKTLLSKMIAFLLIMTCDFLNANGQSEPFVLTKEFKNVTAVDVFNHIESLSDYAFTYNDQELRKVGGLNLIFNKTPLNEVLEECLKGTPYSFEILSKHVVIKKR